jgi:hypothetical protein
MIGYKRATEAVDVAIHGRGAFHVRGSRGASPGGAHGKANVGMSNDKTGVKPVRRKTKVS